MRIQKFDRTAHQTLIESLIKDYQQSIPVVSSKSEKPPVPIFIVGMPRTGSTLIESILVASGGVQTIGESDLFKQSVEHASGKNIQQCTGCINNLSANTLQKIHDQYLKEWDGSTRYLLNKNLFNYLYVGAIFKVLNNARVIYMTRDTLDTMLSCYGINFAGSDLNFCYDLEDLGWYYRQCSKLMAHWNSVFKGRILTVSYEGIANGNDELMQQVFSFCGIPYDENWRNFYQSEHKVLTASFRQVRLPLYTSSIHRGEAFKKFLQPAIDALNAET